MLSIASITFKGLFRDQVFRGILMIALIFLFLPSISELSMRQVAELSLTLSLSVLSFILLLLSLFLGGTSLWKDVDRKYTFTVLGLPLTRTSYVLGKFAGIAGFILLTSLVLGIACFFVAFQASHAFPPERPIVWSYVAYAIVFDMLKYILLIAFAFLFSTVSTSFFLPIFGTISVFFVGSATQEVYEYIKASASNYSPLFLKTITVLYYLLPNFGAFDLKVHAIYGVPVAPAGLVLLFAYFLVYVAILLTLSTYVFSRREIQ